MASLFQGEREARGAMIQESSPYPEARLVEEQEPLEFPFFLRLTPIGQHLNVTLLSVTGGDDKPAKYPMLFRAADALLFTKADLLPVLDDFDPDRAERHLRELANPAPVFSLSVRRGKGMDAWIAWLHEQRAAQRARIAQDETRPPRTAGVGLHAT